MSNNNTDEKYNNITCTSEVKKKNSLRVSSVYCDYTIYNIVQYDKTCYYYYYFFFGTKKKKKTFTVSV